MRTFAVAAGLAAVASANTYTHVETADVTITSCSPTHTNCPYKPESGHWEDWETTSSTPAKETTTSKDPWEDWSSTTSSTPVKITSTSYYDPSHTWADWTASTPVDPTTEYTWNDWEATTSTPAVETSTTSCPAYTATAPPAWFSYLPSDVKSSIAAKWTGAPPADWCYYTYSTSTLAAATSTPVYAASSYPASPVSPVEGYSSSPVSPEIATYTGAASSNTGNFVVVGLVAAAALVMA